MGAARSQSWCRVQFRIFIHSNRTRVGRLLSSYEKAQLSAVPIPNRIVTLINHLGNWWRRKSDRKSKIEIWEMLTLNSWNGIYYGMKAIEIEIESKTLGWDNGFWFIWYFFFFSFHLSTRQSSDIAIVAPNPANIYQFKKLNKNTNTFQRCRNEKKKSPAKYLELRKTEGNTE